MPAPFDGELFTFYNPDGSEVRVRGWGNQFAAVFETLDGYTVIKDARTGFYQYATLSPDRQRLVPSGIQVSDREAGPPHVPQHVRAPRATVRADVEALREASGVEPRWQVRRRQRQARQRAAAESAGDTEESEDSDDPEAAGTTGDYVGLVILVEFPDVPGTITHSQVNDFCNTPGHTGFGNNGSAYDYFLAVSDGKLRYTNQVTAYYTAQHPRDYYTDPSIPFGTRARELIIEALDHLKVGGYDFSGLSSDSAGFVYALSVFYAGPRVNNWSEGLWPHSWALASPYIASSTKKFSDYQITDMGNQLTLRTFCHENGHMICDFPDLYDYGGEGAGVGHYCLMCYGGSNTNPVQVDAYLKNVAGWTSKLTTLTPAMTATTAAGTNDFLIHKKSATEYFILENRQQSGRDAALPDAGLAIWHVDELGSNNNEQMTPGQHYELSLEQSDNRFDLEHSANAGDVDDLYGGSGASLFGDATTPDSKWWDGTSSGLEIQSISAPGPTITVQTRGGAADMSSVVGTWAVIAVDWGCTGTVAKATPFTFNADGTWSYGFGGGRWLQVGGIVEWNFNNAAGLTYSANIGPNAMSGIMGYLTTGGLKGCFYALRSPSPSSPGALASLLSSLLGDAQNEDSAIDVATSDRSAESG
jgi:M6 family metalloprotease-like protein